MANEDDPYDTEDATEATPSLASRLANSQPAPAERSAPHSQRRASQSGELPPAVQHQEQVPQRPRQGTGPLPAQQGPGQYAQRPAHGTGPLPAQQPASPPADGGFAESVTSFSVAPSGPKRRIQPAALIGIVAVVGVVAFLIVARLVVDQWVSPGSAMIWMAAGTLLPTVLVGVILGWPSGEAFNVKRTLATVGPGAVVSTVAVLVAAGWAVPAVRSSAVSFAPTEPGLMVLVLDDENLSVAVAGCKVFAPWHDSADYRTRMLSALTRRPELATKCMSGLSEEIQLGLAASLADRWSRELSAEDEEPDKEHLCGVAGSMSQLPIERAQLNARLLRCAMSSPTLVSQDCCGAALGATIVDPRQWAGHLRDTMDYVHDDRTAVGVFAMAFQQRGLSEEQLRFAKAVHFDAKEPRAAALDFACNAVANGKTAVIPHMRAALEKTCDVESEAAPASQAVWSEICFLSTSEIASRRDKPPPLVMLCDAAQDVLAMNAIETAKGFVAMSANKDVGSKLAKSIDLGYVKVLEYIGTPAGAVGDHPSYVSEQDARRARSHLGFRPQQTQGRSLKEKHRDELRKARAVNGDGEKK